MRLYSGTSVQFIADTTQNQIAEKLRESFFIHFRFYPSPSEVNSWRNSLRAIKDIFVLGNLIDHGIILEYQLPLSSKRLDCLICGKNSLDKENAIIIELKQWEKCAITDAENSVMTYVGGGQREVLHPSVQVGQYKKYIADVHTAFNEGEVVDLSACCFLHNYTIQKNDVLMDEKFRNSFTEFPIFSVDDSIKFKDYLVEKMNKGDGLSVLKKIEESKYRPSKKLMENVSAVIKNEARYILLDEQKVVFDKVLAIAKEGFHNRKKNVLIIHGGPGTGKSVIAINLMAELLKNHYTTHYATGSKSFTQTLWEIVGDPTLFKYFNNYSQAQQNEIDVLICDESHRIRVSSNHRFTKLENRSDIFQIEELLKAAKVSVFFIDDRQIVRPGEIGSSAYIKEYAEKYDAIIHEYFLEAQFRCNGSDAFINWIDNTLDIRKTANILWDRNDEFDFKIFDSPFDLETAVTEKNKQGFSARLMAGFCWKWSDPNADGTLIDDVSIGTFHRPWNAKPKDMRKNNKSVRLKNIPESNLWAYDANGVGQVGCIYTAQGFEFDYAGIIIGKDLTYDFNKGWLAHKDESQDTVVRNSKDQFLELIKNTYRVLFTRGMKGCYVYFADKTTEKFFKSRIE
jgi:DUF2075 family protein/DNA replication protein DnaC